jgi:hypothetical protein
MKIIAQYVWGSLDYYGAEIDKYTEHLLKLIWIAAWKDTQGKQAMSYRLADTHREVVVPTHLLEGPPEITRRRHPVLSLKAHSRNQSRSIQSISRGYQR